MTTAADIISDAYLFAGIGDQYNPLDGSTVATGLRLLNYLIDSYSTEELTIFGYTEGTFPLVVGQQIYLVGPANQLGVRPTQVEAMTIVDSSSVSHGVKIIGTDQWSDIIYLPAPGRPEYIYNDGNSPVSNWYFWPKPAFTGDVVHVWYWAQLPQFAALANTLTAPPGFAWFLVTSLGASLATFNKKTLDPQAMRQYRMARANARALSRQPKVLGLDVPVDGPPWYSIYSDSGPGR